MRDQDEREAIREHFAGEPGKGHIVEQILGQRENLGPDDDETRAAIDARVAALGYTTREQAAAARKAGKAAKAEHDDGQAADAARREPPAGRRAPSRQTADRPGKQSAAGDK